MKNQTSERSSIQIKDSIKSMKENEEFENPIASEHKKFVQTEIEKQHRHRIFQKNLRAMTESKSNKFYDRFMV